MTFDSIAEESAAPAFAALGAIRCNTPFDTLFEDKKGETFAACPDFYHDQFGVFIEYKPCSLNNKTFKKSADNKVRAQLTYRGYSIRADEVLHSWSNSAFKQAIVQQTLGHYNFVVCFAKPPTPEEADYYETRGIAWCTLRGLRNYLAFAHFRKRGLDVAFTQSAKTYTLTVH